jgi:hypothetical protein
MGLGDRGEIGLDHRRDGNATLPRLSTLNVSFDICTCYFIRTIRVV